MKNEMTDTIPALCPKSANPYTYCPLVFKHADEMINSYCTALALEIKRVHGLGNTQVDGEDARLIDRYCGEITAYMNGRIHQILNDFLKNREVV